MDTKLITNGRQKHSQVWTCETVRKKDEGKGKRRTHEDGTSLAWLVRGRRRSGPFETMMMFTLIVSSFILGILFCCCYLMMIMMILIMNLVYYNVGARPCICSSSRHLSRRDHIQVGSGVRPVSHPVVIVGSFPGNKGAGPWHKSLTSI
jgi:hypothetical protein